MFTRLLKNSGKAIRALVSRRIVIMCDGIPYHFCTVPYRKILNWIRVETSILSQVESPRGWPTHLQVEPTNVCNLKCALCPVTEGLRRPTGRMSAESFAKLIDEIGDYLFLILLWDWGEPFLNPAVYEMIAYARRHGIKVVSSTNGHIFAEGDHARRVVESGLDSLIFAIDGISQETYDCYRKGGHLDTLISGVKKVVAAKRVLNSTSPFLNLRFIVMRHNEHEIPRLRDFAGSLGVDALTLKTLNPHDEFTTEEDSREFLPSDACYQRFRYDSVTSSRIQRRQNPCKALWNNPVVHWDGKVSPCTFDPYGIHTVGDLGKEDFKSIWWGASYQELRRQFHENYQNLNQCSVCSYAFEGGTLSLETIVQSHFFTAPSRDII